MIDPGLLRTCLTCKHFGFHTADAGYSEYTPSSPMGIECYKMVWNFNEYESDLREILHTATRCDKYEFAVERAVQYRWLEKPQEESNG